MSCVPMEEEVETFQMRPVLMMKIDYAIVK